MRWNKITIETTTEAEETISYELSELGFEGVEVEDHVPLTQQEMDEMFIDLLPDDQLPDDGTAKISCYIDEEKDITQAVAQIEAMLAETASFLNIGSGKITLDKTDEEDWINNWKVFFKPFRLDDNIIIKPTWETFEDEREGDIIIDIDPGTAFGSGSHETTKLCITQLKKYIKEDTTLFDVGTGSGILSIIGLKLGAKYAAATDIDPRAIEASRENFEKNGITREQADVFLTNVVDPAGADTFVEEQDGRKYDVVVANILAQIIIPLASQVKKFLKDDGVFISSGIINTMEEDVKQAILANGFEIIEITHMNDWVSITAKPL